MGTALEGGEGEELDTVGGGGGIQCTRFVGEGWVQTLFCIYKLACRRF